jgi:DNA-binding NarL/FixJ family response regulator
MPRTVLVVDDSAPFRATARGLLEARGYDVVGDAANGAAGLAAARALRPDAVLLDVNLPDVDGMTVAGQLGDDGYAPAIVLVSTLDASSFGRSLESCGARGFVPKAELGSPRLVELLGPPDG